MKERTVILVAVEAERKALARAISGIEVRQIGVRGCLLRDEWVPESGRVILAGLGGGLNPALACGEVVVDPWPGGFAMPGARAGVIRSSPTILATTTAKAAFRAQTLADAVDMELDMVSAVAAGRGATVISARAIFDVADENLPRGIEHWLTPEGKTRLGPVMLYLAGNPLRLGSLLAMARRSRIALANLARVTAALVGRGGGTASTT